LTKYYYIYSTKEAPLNPETEVSIFNYSKVSI